MWTSFPHFPHDFQTKKINLSVKKDLQSDDLWRQIHKPSAIMAKRSENVTKSRWCAVAQIILTINTEWVENDDIQTADTQCGKVDIKKQYVCGAFQGTYETKFSSTFDLTYCKDHLNWQYNLFCRISGRPTLATNVKSPLFCGDLWKLCSNFKRFKAILGTRIRLFL